MARVDTEVVTQADFEVTVHVGEKVEAQAKTKVTTQVDMESSVHTYEGFPGGSSDCSLVIAYIDHVAFILWQ